MLTKEECLKAVELIKESYGEGEFQYNYDEIYLLEQLINEHFELVEKTTPKKISKKVDRLKYNHYFCNSCSAYLGSEFLPKGNYCPTCGQKIDWSEEDVD